MFVYVLFPPRQYPGRAVTRPPDQLYHSGSVLTIYWLSFCFTYDEYILHWKEFPLVRLEIYFFDNIDFLLIRHNDVYSRCVFLINVKMYARQLSRNSTPGE